MTLLDQTEILNALISLDPEVTIKEFLLVLDISEQIEPPLTIMDLRQMLDAIREEDRLMFEGGIKERTADLMIKMEHHRYEKEHKAAS